MTSIRNFSSDNWYSSAFLTYRYAIWTAFEVDLALYRWYKCMWFVQYMNQSSWLLESSTVPRIFMKFSPFCRTQNFIITLTKDCQWRLSQLTESSPRPLCSFEIILLWSSHNRLFFQEVCLHVLTSKLLIRFVNLSQKQQRTWRRIAELRVTPTDFSN
jgi:hypothetical protein